MIFILLFRIKSLAQFFIRGIIFFCQIPKIFVSIAKKEFPTLDPVIVESAVRRMVAENVYPTSVQTTPNALKVAMDTQIALGNLKVQPDYAKFVVQTYVKKALALP